MNQYHIMERQPPKIFININCSGCNKKFSLQKSQYTWKKKNGQKKFYCSRSCSGLYYNGHKKSDYYKIILKEYNAGKTGYRISKDHNILKATVYYHLNKIKEQL